MKSILNELECLLGDATAALQIANEHLSPLMDMVSAVGLDPQESSGEVGFMFQLSIRCKR